MTQVVYDRLGLARDTRIVTYNEDARMVLKRSPAKRYNLIMGDAFNDFSVPYHLTTREFNDRVREWLTPQGYYMVNLIDGPQREFLRSYTRTMQQTFDHVYIIPAIEFWKSAQRMTYVVIGSMEPIDLDAVPPLDPGRSQSLLAQMVLRDDQMAEVMAEGPTALLTDGYAPVDQMLTPVFRDEVVR